jgi:hypothetical protein
MAGRHAVASDIPAGSPPNGSLGVGMACRYLFLSQAIILEDTGMFTSTPAPTRAALILQQLTPVQKDVLLVAAMPQIYRWSERWVPPSHRQDAIAWGLVRRGVLQESARQLGAYAATALGKQVARLLIAEDLAHDQDMSLSFGR